VDAETYAPTLGSLIWSSIRKENNMQVCSTKGKKGKQGFDGTNEVVGLLVWSCACEL